MKKLSFVILKAILVIVATMGSLIVLENIVAPSAEMGGGVLLIVKVFADTLMALMPILVCLWFFKKAAWDLIGLQRPIKTTHVGVGALWGIAFIVGLVGLIIILGGIQFKGIRSDYAISGLIFLVITSFTVSVGEEVLFRGALQGIFKQAYGRWAGIIISSVIFFLIHSGNPGMFESILPPLNLFLGGLIIALIRERTGSLWIPIGLHWTWNLFQDLFGFATSGFSAKESLFMIHFIPGRDLVNGGNFGIEGSIVSIVALLVVCVYLVNKLPKKVTSMPLN
jgi:membrane protease YdiL (CAAX protease family)